MPYLGISQADREQMLQEIGVQSLDELFFDIPENLLFKRELNLEAGLSEWELSKYFDKLAASNHSSTTYNFKGAGCYQHHVPALVKAISSRGEFLTSYTPYQAEVSQGTLEAIFRFQSFMAELTGLDIANASMYDGATAFAEALTMSHRLNKKRKIYLSPNIHPEYLEVARNFLHSLDIDFEFFDSLEQVEQGSTLAIQNPDFYGELLRSEQAEFFARTVREREIFLITVHPEAFALSLKPKPIDLGAEIACGSAQSFGNAPYLGGAQVGFIASREAHVRQMPGRIIGLTTDRNGKEGLVLTFQAREQHIKRDRASSNICTNQSLHALCAAVYLSYMGEAGLHTNAREIYIKTLAFKQALEAFPIIKIQNQNFFNEITIELQSPSEDDDANALIELYDLLASYGVRVDQVTANSPYSTTASSKFLFAISETNSLEEINDFLDKLNAKYKQLGGDIRTPCIKLDDLNKLTVAFDETMLAEINIPNRSELAVCRDYTQLSQKNFSIDTNFYPLGSCTMKYNPKINDELASDARWANLHPYMSSTETQGALKLMDELKQNLTEITGFYDFSLQPAAGAHGEYSALLMAKKYFRDQGQKERNIVLVPDSAHGTNPASAAMAGFKTVTVKSNDEGNVDLDDLNRILSKYQNKIAVFMLTNPNTFGLFNKNILEVVKLIHEDGGLMYYDGANLNAIVGVSRPGDMGFDLVHLNLHKTFSTPHGGGGPGAGPVGASKELAPYLPGDKIEKLNSGERYWAIRERSIGRIRSFHGNFNVLIRALAYIKRHGREGIARIGEYSTLNANYIQSRVRSSKILSQDDIFQPYFSGLCKHEFIISAQKLKETYGITALDVAKRLLDKGIHAPTIYFPISIPEVIMIEPTETENKEVLDSLITALEEIVLEAQTEEGREILKTAPHTTEFSRFDEVKAVKEPKLTRQVTGTQNLLYSN